MNKQYTIVYPPDGVLVSHKKAMLYWWHMIQHKWTLKFFIMLTEGNQMQKAGFYVIQFIWNVQNRQSIEIEISLLVAWELEVGNE